MWKDEKMGLFILVCLVSFPMDFNWFYFSRRVTLESQTFSLENNVLNILLGAEITSKVHLNFSYWLKSNYNVSVIF